MSISWPWINLIIAGGLEVCWAIGLKYTQGFTKLGPSIFTASTLISSMYFLAQATKTLPIGTAYGVWVGIGIFGTVVLGIILFNESIEPVRLFFLGLLMVSLIGLNLTS